MPADAPSDHYALNPADTAFFQSEKRLHIRAFRYWESLLHGRPFPALKDMSAEGLADFKLRSALMRVAEDDPVLRTVGVKLASASGGDYQGMRVFEVPDHTLLGRVARAYTHVLEDRLPVGLDASLPQHDGAGEASPLPFRGILLPFADDGETIDYVVAVVSWKESLLVLPDAPENAGAAPVLGELQALVGDQPGASPELRGRLRALPALGPDAEAWSAPDAAPFKLVLASRQADGRLAPVMVLDEPDEVVDAAVERAARTLAARDRSDR